MKYIQCRTCSKKPGPKGMLGFYYITLSNGQQGIMECTCHKKYVQEEVLRINSEKSGIWYVDYDVSQYVGTKSLANVEKLKAFVSRFKEPKFSSSVLYLYGPNGTQKTTLAQWMGLNLLRDKVSVRYLLMQHLITLLKDKDFETDEAVLDEIEALKNIDCLIIDEAFNPTSVTLYKSGYQLPFLVQFLKDRVESRRKGVVFVSNKAPTEISKSGFGDTVESFIVRNTVPQGSNLLFEDNVMATQASFNIEKLFD